jgi:hypothetical protein
MGGRNVSIKARLVCSLAILFLFLPIAGFSQTAVSSGVGSVEGVVLGEDNKPLSGASVYGLPEEDMRKEIWGTSDNAGKFTLQNVPAGNVYVHAFKESEGYPNHVCLSLRKVR